MMIFRDGRWITGDDRTELRSPARPPRTESTDGPDLTEQRDRRAALARYAHRVLDNRGKAHHHTVMPAAADLARLLVSLGHGTDWRETEARLLARYTVLIRKVGRSDHETKTKVLRFAFADLCDA